MSEIKYVVDGAILGCTGCMDSMMRNSGPGIIVTSQHWRFQSSRLIATDRDINIPPFSHCDVLVTCTPVITSEWIETDDNMSPPALVFGESLTFCDAGCGVIGAVTSGQDPMKDALTREEEIERVSQFFKNMNEMGKEAGGWRVGELNDAQLRQIATDYVDVMRAIATNRDANGSSNLLVHGQNVIDAFCRLADSYSYDLYEAVTNLEVRHAQAGTRWPMINGNAIFGLAIDQAIPNSWQKNLIITGGILAAVTLPLWGPAAAGALTTGAKSAWAYVRLLVASAAGTLQRTATVLNNIASRPYINSSLTVQQIMSAATPTKDAFLQNGLKWIVEGSFNGVNGIYELVIDVNTQTIMHFLFKSTQ